MTTCDPDCDERTNCGTVGELGHSQCGRCPECREPRHHGCVTACHAELKAGEQA